MPQLFISTQQEYNDALKQKLNLGNELVITNNPDFIVVKTDVTVGKNGRCKTADNAEITVTVRENGIAGAQGKTTINGYDNANILAQGNCKINLYDNSFANVREHCHITLKGKTRVSADGNCTVHAYDEAEVSASGSSKVYTYQKSTARGTDTTALSGSGDSTLHGQKNCAIKAKDNCVVYASDNCTVQAADNCMVVAGNNTKIAAQGDCLIMTKDNPHITLHDKCEHINLEQVNDKNIMGTLKQMAQTKAVIDKPYIAIQALKENIPPQRKESVNRRLNTMGLKDQIATKNYLYSLIEAEPAQSAQIEAARKAGYVQGVCECVAVVGNEHNMGTKLLAEMKVNKGMAQKFAKPETFKELEQGIFKQTQQQTQTQGVKR